MAVMVICECRVVRFYFAFVVRNYTKTCPNKTIFIISKIKAPNFYEIHVIVLIIGTWIIVSYVYIIIIYIFFLQNIAKK